MILSDASILKEIEEGRLKINPPISKEDLSTCTLDVHLGNKVEIFKATKAGVIPCIDLADPKVYEALKEYLTALDIPPEGYFIHPGNFVVADTLEEITLPSRIAARLEGRSTNARFGLTIHATAPTIQAKFHGTIKLEISNVGKYPLILKRGFPIGQLIFEQLDSEPLSELTTVWQNQKPPL